MFLLMYDPYLLPSCDSFLMTFTAGKPIRSAFPNFSARQQTLVLRIFFFAIERRGLCSSSKAKRGRTFKR